MSPRGVASSPVLDPAGTPRESDARLEEATHRYERSAAAALGAAHVTSFAFARHGLMAVLAGLDAGNGDEVILPPLTCKVVPLALLAAGVTPVYADIDPATLNLDAAAVERAVGPKTRAVLFQHTYGNSRGIAEVARVTETHGLPLIEDCAQCLPYAAGTWQPGRTGIAAIFSNNLGKPLSAGSGGLLSTEDDALQARILAWRAHLPVPSGIANLRLRLSIMVYNTLLRPERYWMLYDAHRRAHADYHIRSLADELDAGIVGTRHRAGRVQVERGAAAIRDLAVWADHRKQCCAAYRAQCADLPAGATVDTEPEAPLYYFPVLVPDKPALLAEARRRRVEIIPWPIRTPIYPVTREADLDVLGYEPGRCARAEATAGRLVGLPTHRRIRERHLRAVTDLLHDHFGRAA
jgi:dTDP-4-amino-4,6-dideoxygalactose transaminase